MTFPFQVGMTWIEAQGQCEILGGYLAAPNTEEKHKYLESMTVKFEV